MSEYVTDEQLDAYLDRVDEWRTRWDTYTGPEFDNLRRACNDIIELVAICKNERAVHQDYKVSAYDRLDRACTTLEAANRVMDEWSDRAKLQVQEELDAADAVIANMLQDYAATFTPGHYGERIVMDHPRWERTAKALEKYQVFSDEQDARSLRRAQEALRSKLEERDDLRSLCDRFASALYDKLRAADEKYGYDGGWKEDGWRDDLVQRMLRHIDKGDPRDVAAYCAFAWYHGWSIAPDQPLTESYESCLDSIRQIRSELGLENYARPDSPSVVAEETVAYIRLQQAELDAARKLRDAQRRLRDHTCILCQTRSSACRDHYRLLVELFQAIDDYDYARAGKGESA